MTDNFPRIMEGKRATLAGRTGSGKSTTGCWLLNRSPLHWVILNPKWTAAYRDLPDSNVVDSLKMKEIVRSIERYKFTVINPPSSSCEPDILDRLILLLHENFTNLGLCVDELYSVHINGKAGPGVTGWLTRGRELGQSFLGLTQRPAWVSKFLFSEADYIGGMSLVLEDDRKKLFDMTGRMEYREKLPPYHWLWYEVAADQLRSFGPVPVKK